MALVSVTAPDVRPVLAQRYEPGFAGYMRLQRNLLRHWLARGRPAEQFAERVAPRFRARYARAFGLPA